MSDEADLSPAEVLKSRLRRDVQIAMRARAPSVVSVLRVCLAAIDNAEAPPVGDAHRRYEERPFGDGSAEVPRLALDEARLRDLLETEIAARQEAAADYSRAGALLRAKALKDEAALIARYLPGAPL